MTLLIKFKVGGLLRFLSHAQMLMVFQRACIRAGINLRYSEGFNPRPRMSLPLPKPVGVESDDELLILSLIAQDTIDQTRIMDTLSAQLPHSCELLSICIDREKKSHAKGFPRGFQPSSAVYVFTVRDEYFNKILKNTVNHLLDSESLVVSRSINIKSPIGTGRREERTKKIDVRDYMKSIELEDGKIMVKCGFTSAGSVRIQEILELLDLDIEKLSAPIRRTNVQWRVN